MTQQGFVPIFAKVGTPMTKFNAFVERYVNFFQKCARNGYKIIYC